MATRQQQQQHHNEDDNSKMEMTCPSALQQQQRLALKRKREEDSGGGDKYETWRPPKRVSPFLNTPKQRRDEKRKLLRTSINKLREIENAEVCLHRAVLLHNTVRKLQKQLRDEKMQPSPYGPYPDGRSYLSANAHLFVDHFVYADMEQIVDNSDLLDRMIGSLQTEAAETKITKTENLAVVPKPVDLSGKDACVYVDENCNQNQDVQVHSQAHTQAQAQAHMCSNGQYNMVSSCSMNNGQNDLSSEFSVHHLYPQSLIPPSLTPPSLTPPPVSPPPISDIKDTCACNNEVDSVLDMRIKEDKVAMDSCSKSTSSDTLCSDSDTLASNTLSGSIARAMNCVEGGGNGPNGEELVRSVITSSCSPPCSPPQSPPSTCLAGHTGYFSVVPGDSQVPQSALSSSPISALHHGTASTCSEAYQRERSGNSLSPFLALLDEPWSNRQWSLEDGVNGTGAGTPTVDKTSSTDSLDSVLGSLIGVLTGTC